MRNTGEVRYPVCMLAILAHNPELPFALFIDVSSRNIKLNREDGLLEKYRITKRKWEKRFKRIEIRRACFTKV